MPMITIRTGINSYRQLLTTPAIYRATLKSIHSGLSVLLTLVWPLRAIHIIYTLRLLWDNCETQTPASLPHLANIRSFNSLSFFKPANIHEYTQIIMLNYQKIVEIPNIYTIFM